MLFARVLPFLSSVETNLMNDRARISRETAAARSLARQSLDLVNALDPKNPNRAAHAIRGTSVLLASTASTAAAALLNRVSGLAEFAGASVLSASVVGDSAFHGDHAEVATRMSLALDDVALVKFVSAVEADPAHLVILSIHVVRATPAAIGAEARALRAELTVSAVARRGAEPEPPGALRVATQ